MSRKSFTERRRARLRMQVDRLDRLETRNTITEPVSVTGLSVTALRGLALIGVMGSDDARSAAAGAAQRAKETAAPLPPNRMQRTAPRQLRANYDRVPAPYPSGHWRRLGRRTTRVRQTRERLGLDRCRRLAHAQLGTERHRRATRDEHSLAARSASRRRCRHGTARRIGQWRLACYCCPRQRPGRSIACSGSARRARGCRERRIRRATRRGGGGRGGASRCRRCRYTRRHPGSRDDSPPGERPGGAFQSSGGSSPPSGYAQPPTDAAATSPASGGTLGLGSIPGPVRANASGPSQNSFPYFPLYVRDVNDGVILFPGVDQLAKLNGSVVLQAQVSGTTVLLTIGTRQASAPTPAASQVRRRISSVLPGIRKA